MKRSITLITLTLSVLFAFNADAQMSKSEAKEWKKRIKKLQPEQYKQLLDENKALKGQVTSLKTELGSVDDRIAEKDEQMLTYQSQLSDLRSELSKAQSAKPATTAVAAAPAGNMDDTKGIVFKVQIGAFEKVNLSEYVGSSSNFGEDKEGGLNKYTIGVFRDYWKASTFKKYIRQMGIKDAFVASYKDGARVPLKEVLEEVSKKS